MLQFFNIIFKVWIQVIYAYFVLSLPRISRITAYHCASAVILKSGHREDCFRGDSSSSKKSLNIMCKHNIIQASRVYKLLT